MSKDCMPDGTDKVCEHECIYEQTFPQYPVYTREQWGSPIVQQLGYVRKCPDCEHYIPEKPNVRWKLQKESIYQRLFDTLHEAEQMEMEFEGSMKRAGQYRPGDFDIQLKEVIETLKPLLSGTTGMECPRCHRWTLHITGSPPYEGVRCYRCSYDRGPGGL